MLSATLVLLPALQFSPEARMKAYFQSAPRFSVQFTARPAPDAPGVKGSWAAKTPNTQHFMVESPAGRQELRQTPDGILIIDHAFRQYAQYRAFSRIAPPPDTLAPAADYHPLLLPALISGAEIPKFKEAGRETLPQGPADKLVYEDQTQTGSLTLTAHVGLTGALLRAEIVVTGMGGYRTIFEFTGHNPDDPAVDAIDLRLPRGYTPFGLPAIERPPIPGTPVKLGSWSDARTGRSVSVAGLASKGVVIFFTAPRCAPSAAAEAAIRRLAQTLNTKNIPVIEVILPTSPDQPVAFPKPDLAGKDPARRVFVDDKGEIFKQFQPPVTPYLFAIDSQGILRRAYAGFTPGEDERLIETLLPAFEAQE